MDSNQNGSANCLPPNALVGEFRLLNVIGEGGFGIVYRAQDLSLDRVVAIKEYLPATMASRTVSSDVHVRSQHRGAFDAGLRSFINEARLLAKFSHPALVQVYRFFEANGTAYMVMRCYEGQTLRAYLDSKPRQIDQRWLSATLCPLLDVLEMLHAADCYHRDIAPDNVFLQTSGMPVMLDFGAARRIISDMTQALTMILKPGFAPIEQYAEDGSMPQGAWTDIYQLGALLYQAITGRTPTTSVARMINDPIKPLSPEQYPGYSAGFLTAVHKAMAVNPQDRPQSIAELKPLLGIAEFSAASYNRFSTELSAPDTTLSSLGSPHGEMPMETLFQVTTSRADLAQAPAIPAPSPLPPAGARAEPRPVASSESLPNTKPSAAVGPLAATPSPPGAAGPDGLLSLFDQAQPAPMPTTVQLHPSAGESSRATAQAAPKPAPAPDPAKANRLSTAAPMKPAQQGHKIWAGAALLVLSLAVGAGLWWWNGSSSASAAAGEEEALWARVEAQPTVPSLESFLAAHPKGVHHAEADRLLQQLKAATVAPVSAQPQMPEPVVEQQATSSSAPPADGGPLPSTQPQDPLSGVPSSPPSVAQTDPNPVRVPIVRGKVVLRVTPWGRIFVDRAGVGVTPPKMELDLPVGKHRIAVTNPASEPMVWNVVVTANEPVVLTHHFEVNPPAPTQAGN